MAVEPVVPATPATIAETGAPRRSPRLLTRMRRRLRDPIGMMGLAIVSLMVLAALLGHLLWPIDYSAEDYDRLAAPSASHPMGTDELGRDVFSRVLHGAQVSLEIGLIAVGIALALGTVIALAAVF